MPEPETGAGGGTASTTERDNLQRLNAMRQQTGGEEKPAEDAGEGEGGEEESITLWQAFIDALWPKNAVTWFFQGMTSNNIKRVFMRVLIDNFGWFLVGAIVFLIIIGGIMGFVSWGGIAKQAIIEPFGWEKLIIQGIKYFY